MFNKRKNLNDKIRDQYSKGNYIEVNQLCKKSLSLEKNVDILNLEACAYYQQGDYANALKIFDEILVIDSNIRIVYYNRGCVNDSLNKFDDAISDYNKALNFNLNDSDCYANRSVSRFSHGDLNGALKDINKAIKLDPQDGEFYSNRAYIFKELNLKHEAMEDGNIAEGYGVKRPNLHS